MIRRIVGCMTGTSIDGIDTALVEIEGSGLAMKPRFIRGVSHDLGPVRDPLRRLADQHPMTAADIAAAMREFALVHLQAIRGVLGPPRARCDLVCVHGQTVFHQPPLSWQLMQPAPIARELGIPVVFDLRAMDLAAGGQGAPITPIADWLLFDAEGEYRTIVNLGGFCNVTVLPGVSRTANSLGPAHSLDSVRARDICACNQLLDGIARARLREPFDTDGRAAMAGQLNARAFETIRSHLEGQAQARRSLGTGDELSAYLGSLESVSGPDLAKSAVEAIAETIVSKTHGMLILAGGGIHNQALVSSIRSRSRDPVSTTDTLGVPAGFREAASFAILGALCQDRIPITLPQVTGVPSPAPISGAWVYP